MEATQEKPQKRSLVFTALVVGAFISFILFGFANRDTVRETYELLIGIELRYVLLLPLIQVVNYFLIGNYYRTMFGRFGVAIKPGRAWGVVAAMNFVNQVLPSGGLSGISYLAYGFHAKISTGKTTLIQIGRYLGAFGTYILLIPVAAVLVFFDGNSEIIADISGRVVENPVAIIGVLLFFVFCGLMFAGIRSESHSHIISGWLVSGLNALVRPFMKARRDVVSRKQVSGAIEEFHEGVRFFRGSRSQALLPLMFMSLSVMFEMSIVYVSLLAVGAQVDVTTVFIAFAAANVAGVVSVVPGDVGVHEAVIIFVLGAFSVPVSVALSATLLYRVFNKVIFLPVGFYFYTQFLKPAKQQ